MVPVPACANAVSARKKTESNVATNLTCCSLMEGWYGAFFIVTPMLTRSQLFRCGPAQSLLTAESRGRAAIVRREGLLILAANIGNNFISCSNAIAGFDDEIVGTVLVQIDRRDEVGDV